MPPADPKGQGQATGDRIHIHIFQSGSIQMVTDVGIDPAGDVSVANNWKVVDAVVAKHPADRISTTGSWQGVVVAYGIAAPVKTPLLGQVRQP